MGKKTPDGKVIENDTDLVMYFLEIEHVAVVQGAAYGLSAILSYIVRNV